MAPFTHPRRLIALLCGLGLVAGLALFASAQAPDPVADARLRKRFNVEVRDAALGDVLRQLGRALKISLSAEPSLADQRISAYADRTTVVELQEALTALLKGHWSNSPKAPGKPRYRFTVSPGWENRVLELRRKRQLALVNGWLDIEAHIGQANPESYAAQVRADLTRRRPDIPANRVAQVDANYLRQSLLLEPLRPAGKNLLARGGVYWIAARRLSDRQQAMFTAYVRERRRQFVRGDGNPTGADAASTGPSLQGVAAAGAAGAPPNSGGFGNLSYPQSRIEYRLVYGDRWSDDLLLVRVGVPDDWAEARLPGALVAMPEYSSLYPNARSKPGDREVYRRPKGRFDFGKMTLDQALTALAKAAKIRILADAFQRPEIYAPPRPPVIMQGYTVREMLDRLAQLHGCFWWKQNGWYLFRHRKWAEETRVAVPERIYRALGERVAAAGGVVPPSGLRILAGLSLEQLLTLHLTGKAAGEPTAPEAAFDLNELQWAQGALAVLRQMNADQLALAVTEGLPATAMSPGQLAVFQRLAEQHGFELLPEEVVTWGFQATSNLQPLPEATPPVLAGGLRFQFVFGPGLQRETELALRLPLPSTADNQQNTPKPKTPS